MKMRKNLEKIALILMVTALISTPFVSADVMVGEQDLHYILPYDGHAAGAWVGTITIPGSPSGTYTFIHWADLTPIFLGPPTEFGILFPGSMEFFHEEWEILDENDVTLASGFDKGFFNVATGKYSVYGKVEMASGELAYLADAWLSGRGVLRVESDGFYAATVMKFWT